MASGGYCLNERPQALSWTHAAFKDRGRTEKARRQQLSFDEAFASRPLEQSSSAFRGFELGFSARGTVLKERRLSKVVVNPRRSGKQSAVLDIYQKRFYWYLIAIGCLIGLIYEIQDLTFNYYLYPTVTELKVSVPFRITAPSLSLCLPYYDMLDRSSEKFAQFGLPVNLGRKEDVEQNITIEGIFDMTPSAVKMVMACQWRVADTFIRKEKKNSSCSGIIEATKHYKQLHVCYNFRLFPLRIDYEFGYDYVAGSLTSPGMLYEVSLAKSSVRNIEEFRAIVYHSGELPWGNKAFPVSLIKALAKIPFNETDEKMTVNNYFSLSYATYSNVLMPAPYATDCIDYRQLKHDSREACLDECKKGKVLEMYDKIPFTSIVVEPEAKRHMSTVDNDDPEVNEKLWKIDHRCQRLCRKPNCLDSIYVTKFVRSEYDDALDFTVRVYATNEPVVESTFKAKIEFAQFAIQVLSTFGIWFGVSLYSFVDIFEDISEFMTHKAETLADSFSHRKRTLKRR